MDSSSIKKRILCIDPGEKNIGVAISDELWIAASPLCVLHHTDRRTDAQAIVQQAKNASAGFIIIGAAYGSQNEETPSVRHAQKLAETVQEFFDGEVRLWDESGSTNAVHTVLIEMGVPQQKRRGHQDARAAAWILQDFLDFEAAKQRNAQISSAEGGEISS